MILIKLKDSDMFGGYPDKSHWYLARKVRNKDEYRLNELTHLYKADKKRINQVKTGLLRKIKISGFETPSGMDVKILSKDNNNNKITFNSLYKMKDPKFNIRNNVRIRYLK